MYSAINSCSRSAVAAGSARIRSCPEDFVVEEFIELRPEPPGDQRPPCLWRYKGVHLPLPLTFRLNHRVNSPARRAEHSGKAPDDHWNRRAADRARRRGAD